MVKMEIMKNELQLREINDQDIQQAVSRCNEFHKENRSVDRLVCLLLFK